MRIVLAHPADQPAQRLLSAWQGEARLLTARDFAAAGWRWYLDREAEEWAVIGGERVPISAIDGIVTRIAGLRGEDLPHVVMEDRDYVAAELTAFLTAWLHRGPFATVNRPASTSLMGPSWRAERWHLAAARAGMRLARTAWKAPSPDAGGSAQPCHDEAASGPTPGAPAGPSSAGAALTITVAGGRAFGEVSSDLAAKAVSMAQRAGADLLAVQVAGPDGDAAFLGAHLWPDVSEPAVAAAILDLLAGQKRATA